MVLQAPAFFLGLGENRLGSVLMIMHQNESTSRWIKLRTAGTPAVHKSIITCLQRVKQIEVYIVRGARGRRVHGLQYLSPVKSEADKVASQ